MAGRAGNDHSNDTGCCRVDWGEWPGSMGRPRNACLSIRVRQAKIAGDSRPAARLTLNTKITAISPKLYLGRSERRIDRSWTRKFSVGHHWCQTGKASYKCGRRITPIADRHRQTLQSPLFLPRLDVQRTGRFSRTNPRRLSKGTEPNEDQSYLPSHPRLGWHRQIPCGGGIRLAL